MRFTAGTLLLAAIGGCGTGILPSELVPQGHRQWIVAVENDSDRPALLLVAEDRGVAGDVVGTAEPSEVPPNTTEDVVLTVPPGESWAVFVNPTRAGGPLIVPPDVPADFEGRLPITIHIGAAGDPTFSHAGELPGWFGQ